VSDGPLKIVDTALTSVPCTELDLNNAQKIHLQGDKYLLGQGYDRDYAAAYSRYQIAASCNLPESSLMLGFMHENGLGRERDITVAIGFYRSAAQLGNGDAMVRLGKLYEKGEAVRENREAAEEYYRAAAGLGHAEGLYRLGRIREVAGDLKGAMDLFRSSAAKGSGQAMNAM
jgi:TPR repeat protein